MGFVVPYINRDVTEVKIILKKKVDQEHIQKRLVLIIVAIALLLDNMLYMVIVPIMPTYLRRINAYDVYEETYDKELDNGTIIKSIRLIYDREDQSLGYLFAIKAIVQLIVNPFSGTLIDRIGYEMPLIIGLMVLFGSTSLFSLGRSYGMLFFARALQGLGSAFADTSGLAMIADRFTEEHERSKAMGIALAFISFGCLVAPPFGGVLYKYSNFNHSVPFMLLSLLCLVDAFMVFMVIKPKARQTETGENVKGTSIWHLFLDPYIAVCSGALIMANVSLAFLEPTIGIWMKKRMPNVTEDLQGLIWLPAFIPHVIGVYATVVWMKKYPQLPWLFAAVGLLMEGVSCFFIPFSTSYFVLILPLCVVCFGIALVDTALLPMLGFLVDTRHVSVYGSVYAIADISYSLAYAFGPMVAGNIEANMGFFALNLIICLTNILYAPALALLRHVYTYKSFDNNELQNFDSNYEGASRTGYGTLDGADSPTIDRLSSEEKQWQDEIRCTGYGYGYDQSAQPEFPSYQQSTLIRQPGITSAAAAAANRVTFDKSLYEKKMKKKSTSGVGYGRYKETDHILSSDWQEDNQQ